MFVMYERYYSSIKSYYLYIQKQGMSGASSRDQAILAKQNIVQLTQIAKQIQSTFNHQILYDLVLKVNGLIGSIDGQAMSHPSVFIQDTLRVLALTIIRIDYKTEINQRIIEQSFVQILIKLVQLIFVPKTRESAIKITNEVMKCQTKLLYRLQQKKQKKYYQFNNDSYKNDRQLNCTEFYQKCVKVILQELSKYPKTIWEMSFDQINNVIEFITSLNTISHSENLISILDIYVTEINAFSLSGRFQKMQLVTQAKFIYLADSLAKKLAKRQYFEKIYLIGPKYALSLFESADSNQKLKGLKMLSYFTDGFFRNKFLNKLPESMYRQLIEKHQLYEKFLTKNISDQMLTAGQGLLKNYKNIKRQSSSTQSKNKLLINLLNQDISQNKKLQKFVFKELDLYYMNKETKQILLDHIQNIKDYSNIPSQYIQIIQQLSYRTYECSKPFFERMFNMVLKIAKEHVGQWPDGCSRKFDDAFRKVTDRFRTQFLSSKKNDEKIEYLTNLIKNILEPVNEVNVQLFNRLFTDGQLWKCLSNNPIQELMTKLIQKQLIYDKIFDFLLISDLKQSDVGQFRKIIQFLTSKNSVKQEINQKYLRVMAKYPKIYEELLKSSGYAQVDSKVKQIISLMQTQSNIPFSMLRSTFLKSNYSNFQLCSLSYVSGVTVLQKHPQNLEHYESLMNLLMQTQITERRREISEFIVDLYMSYGLYKKRNGEEQLIKFMLQVIQHLIIDLEEFKKKKISRSVILANMQLINQFLMATDTLGVGEFPPHNSLVSTSTVSLKVVNCITFGEDVEKSIHKNFPSNLILFDFLTIIGQSFKCGPEEMTLRQGKRRIPITMNGKPIEDINFTAEEITAERNNANRMQSEPLIKQKQLTPKMKIIVSNIFHRFAYQGKMSVIQCTNFIRQASGFDCLTNDRRVRDMIEDYDKDKDGILLQQDFQNYFYKNIVRQSLYKYQSQNMQKYLQNLRYRKNLTLYSQKLDISGKYYLMMRYKLAKHLQFYEEMFMIIDNEDKQIAEKSQQLLLYLPTFKISKKKLLEPLKFQKKQNFKNYYNLITIEHELNSHKLHISEQFQISKSQRIQQFIKQKNDSVIFQLMTSYHSNLDKSSLKFKSFIICLKILRNLINIDNLSKVSIQILSHSSLNIPMLPKSSFFAEQTQKSLKSKNIINFQVVLVLQLTQQTVNLSKIVEGCFDDETQIRGICCNFVYLWQTKTNWKQNLFSINIKQQNSQEWFNLLCQIIKNSKMIDFKQILTTTLNILNTRSQNFTHRYDKLLNGYLKILKTLIMHQKASLNIDIESYLSKILNETISHQNRSLIFEIYINKYEDKAIAYFNDMLNTILPEQQCQIRQMYLGLKNLGAICYMNSILQQFFMIDKFKNMVLQRQVPTNCKTIEKNGKQSVDDFMFQLQRMYHHLQYSQKKYYVPNQFCLTCKDYTGLPINTSIQEDSHQFLNKLVQNAQNAFKQKDKLQKLQSILQTKILNQIECDKCKNRIQKIETTYSVTLQVKEHASLESSLQKFISKEEIQQYFCETCQKRVDRINKRTYIHEAPEIVVFNLQRIIYDLKKGNKIKVHSQLTFPMQLNLAPYMNNNNLQAMNTLYTLKGVVIHTGTSEGGHYYSLIKSESGWYKFNDQSVISFDVNDLPRQAFGGFEQNAAADKIQWQDYSYSTNAYILFYERSQIKKGEIMMIQNIFSQEVEKENVKLIKQLQVHQECFFTAVDRLYEKNRIKKGGIYSELKASVVDKPKVQTQKLRQILRVSLKAFNFLNIFTSVKSDYKFKIAQNITDLLSILPQQTNYYFKQLNIHTFLDNILSNSDSQYRSALKSIFTQNLITTINFNQHLLHHKNQKNKIIYQTLQFLFNYIHNERLHSNISKSLQYFQMLREIIVKDVSIMNFALSQGFVFKLMDILMGRQSMFLKYHPKTQDLPHPIAMSILKTITYILTSKQSQYNHHPHFIKQEIEIAACINFYKRLMRNKYDDRIINDLIRHYSYKNVRVTVAIAEYLLYYINKIDLVENIPVFLSHIDAFLEISDQLQEGRLGWILGIPQFKYIKGANFCLNFSDKSEYMTYISGLFLNCSDSSHKSLLSILFSDSQKMNFFNIYSIRTILQLSVSSNTIFDYFLRLPPPNYHYRTIFDFAERFVVGLETQKDFYIQEKANMLSLLNHLINSIATKINGLPKDVLPYQKYVIGKSYEIKKITQTNKKDYKFDLIRHITYVLQNLPTGNQNKSMPKKLFANDPKEYAHCFLSYRSKQNCESQSKNIQVKPTIFVLEGRANIKLFLKFKLKQFKYCAILSQGFVQINLPYSSEENIQDLIDILPYEEQQKVQLSKTQLQTIFNFKIIEIAVDKKKEDQIMHNDELVAAGINEHSAVITCKSCTFENDIQSERCEMCDQILFM